VLYLAIDEPLYQLERLLLFTAPCSSQRVICHGRETARVQHLTRFWTHFADNNMRGCIADLPQGTIVAYSRFFTL
jgi:hypothetical protein